jgi:hypothetical protein
MLYAVSVPYCGYAYVEVEAESEEEAIKVALEQDDLFDKIEEGEFLEQIVEGNIFHGILNEAEASLIDNEEDKEEINEEA